MFIFPLIAIGSALLAEYINRALLKRAKAK
jgi:hypothetical protein